MSAALQSNTVGVVLAGGRSMRFGARKAMAMFNDAPMIAAVAGALASGVRLTAVSGDADAARALGAPCLDDPPGVARGPLAGVLAGLIWAQSCGAAWIATAPCDTPLLPRDMVPRLASAAAPVALAATADGVQPLCGLWSVATIDALRAALAGDAHPPVHELARALGGVHVIFAEAARFLNVNTQDDLAHAEAWFEKCAAEGNTADVR